MHSAAYLIAFINPETRGVTHVGIYGEYPVTARVGPDADFQALLLHAPAPPDAAQSFGEAAEHILQSIEALPNLRKICDPWMRKLFSIAGLRKA